MARDIVLTQGNKNWFVLLLLSIAVIGIFWGAVVGVKAGELYLTIFTTGIALLFLGSLFIDETDKKTMKEYFRTPITSSPILSMGMWLAGIVTIIVLNAIGKITQSFSTTEFFSSFYFSGASGVDTLSQSFSAGVIESSPLGVWFYSTFVAGTMEEFIWAYALMLLFFMISAGILKTLLDNKAPFGLSNKVYNLGFAIIMAILTFMFIHKLNGSYIGIMFLVAGIFRLLTNTLIYVYGATLSFTIGLHQANNTYAFIQQFGFGVWLEALFTSIYGWIFIIIFVGVVYYVLTHLDEFIKAFKGETLKY